MEAMWSDSPAATIIYMYIPTIAAKHNQLYYKLLWSKFALVAFFLYVFVCSSKANDVDRVYWDD